MRLKATIQRDDGGWHFSTMFTSLWRFWELQKLWVGGNMKSHRIQKWWCLYFFAFNSNVQVVRYQSWDKFKTPGLVLIRDYTGPCFQTLRSEAVYEVSCDRSEGEGRWGWGQKWTLFVIVVALVMSTLMNININNQYQHEHYEKEQKQVLKNLITIGILISAHTHMVLAW